MKKILVAALLGVPGLLRADTLSDMRSALQALKGQAPLSLRVERHTWEREGGKDESGHENFELEDGPKGLRRRDGKALPDGEGKAECWTRAHLELLNLLQLATVLEDKPDMLDGCPVRRLRVSLLQNLNAQVEESGKVKFKKFNLEMTFWVGPEHLPLAADKQMEMEGKATFLLTFSSKGQEHRRYQRIKDRLVMVEANQEAQIKAMGKETIEREIVRCTIL